MGPSPSVGGASMPSSASESSLTSSSFVGLAATVAATAAASAFASWAIARHRYRHERRQMLEDWQNRRQQERTGRIRAEVRLRALRKEHQLLLAQPKQQQPQQLDEKLAKRRLTAMAKDAATTDPPSRLLLTAIGTVVSPFVKRMGTPRQPQVAPSSRGYLQLSHVPPTCLDGLEDYSHAWVLFAFHANTDDHRESGKRRTKVRPPRAPSNVKVGQLATRSPHRPNPIGLSLVRIEKWDPSARRLHVSGVDLVHGTPVFDLKPYVPWDMPGYFDCLRAARAATGGAAATASGDECSPMEPAHASQLLLGHWNAVLRVPDWVSSDDDELSEVEFSLSAKEQLEACVAAGRLAPLYASDNGGVGAAEQTLREILRQDPRSSHLGSSAAGGGRRNNRRGQDPARTTAASSLSFSSSPDAYRLLFGRCQIAFSVRERRVTVDAVEPVVEWDNETKTDGVSTTVLVAEGIPLLMANHPPPNDPSDGDEKDNINGHGGTELEHSNEHYEIREEKDG